MNRFAIFFAAGWVAFGALALVTPVGVHAAEPRLAAAARLCGFG
jgi:hypothetical protein